MTVSQEEMEVELAQGRVCQVALALASSLSLWCVIWNPPYPLRTTKAPTSAGPSQGFQSWVDEPLGSSCTFFVPCSLSHPTAPINSVDACLLKTTRNMPVVRLSHQEGWAVATHVRGKAATKLFLWLFIVIVYSLFWHMPSFCLGVPWIWSIWWW